MKKKILLVFALVLCAVGAAIFLFALSQVGWNFSRLFRVEYTDLTHVIDPDFEKIQIDVGTANVEFIASRDGEVSVFLHQRDKVEYTVNEKNGVITISENNTMEWYDHIFSVSFDTPRIVVSLPSGEYGSLAAATRTGDVTLGRDLTFSGIEISQSTGNTRLYSSSVGDVKIDTGTGNLLVEGVTLPSLDVSVTTGNVTISSLDAVGDVSVRSSTGNVDITDLSSDGLTVNGGTGYASLCRAVARTALTVELSTGEVRLADSDSALVRITTSTGSVRGNLLTGKTFVAKSGTGTVNVPEDSGQNRCEITTGTGSIDISVSK